MESWCAPLLRIPADAVTLPKSNPNSYMVPGIGVRVVTVFLELARQPARFPWRGHRR